MKPLMIFALLFSSFAYMYLATDIIRDDMRAVMRRKYAFAGLLLAIWALSYASMTAATNESLRFVAWSLGNGSALLFFCAWTDFFLDVVKPRGKAAICIPPLMLVSALGIAVWCALSGDVRFVETSMGWQYRYAPTPPFLAMLLYLTAMWFILIIYSVIWYRRETLRRTKKEAQVFLIVTAVTLPLLGPFDYVLPILGDWVVPHIGALVMMVPALIVNHIMRAHWTFSATTSNVSEILFSSLAFPVMLLNADNTVRLANEVSEKTWPEGVIKRSIFSLIRLDTVNEDVAQLAIPFRGEIGRAHV